MKNRLRIPLTDHITGIISENPLGELHGEIFQELERAVFVAPDGKVAKVSLPAVKLPLEALPQHAELTQELYEATKRLQQIIRTSNLNNN